MNIRLAETKDIKHLIKMRWDFTLEYDESKKIEHSSYLEFEKECSDFLENAIAGDQWFIWIAEERERIVSHIYMELIQKAPGPGTITHPFAYKTNMYTIEEYRNKGIGSKLLKNINLWARENNYEMIII
ncbi:GNAT family N-acetyltransferase [Cytobacillus spongiae]|uniref:GNAT family N-acetyltransferase n=1 Tax=Cytobacillus spongiae TaxID=2901381 RepID=UPI001F19CEA3|nr:GNAT family N-acetyltransferase [Cytobacillus spongiae]UII54177.1 GNAT family N-acetyltransferase [Cytobacillus spongiae]